MCVERLRRVPHILDRIDHSWRWRSVSLARLVDMDSVLALVRHGQTDWNLVGRLQGQTDIPLNDTGREQARTVGKELAGQGWDLVLGSPLGRAQQTAEIIATELGAATGPAVEEIVERGFGALEGQCRSELDDNLVQQLLEAAEPRQHVLQRAIHGLNELVQTYPGRRILCVSHGATMRIVRDTMAGFRLERGVENGEVLPINVQQLTQLHRQLLNGSIPVV